MGFRRFFASKDNTITNAYKPNLVTIATSSNMGKSDILEIFHIYSQATTSSQENSRILIQFDTTEISQERQAGLIPQSGSVSYYLKLFNAKHGQTVPQDFKIVAAAVSRSWDEGIGLDMEGYSDEYASNWASASEGVAWTSAGGDYHASPTYEQTFTTGLEDLEIDISGLVEQWLAGTKQNYGLGLRLTSSQETDTSRSYYTKKFFARGTEFFFKKPFIEARFSSSIKDNRGDFYYSSSLATGQENLNTIYLYNYHKGSLRNIPSIGAGNIYVSIFSSSADGTQPTGSSLTLVADGTNVTAGSPTVVTGGWVSTGIYSASFAITASTPPIETIFDVWHNGNLTTQFVTSSIQPKVISISTESTIPQYLLKLSNLKSAYFNDEEARIRLYARPRNWNPNTYTVSQAQPETTILHSASYSVYRIADDLQVIPFGTGSTLHTLMNYDVNGNYFDFDMSLLEADYAYAFAISIYNDYTNSWDINQDVFKFRVEKRQTE